MQTAMGDFAVRFVIVCCMLSVLVSLTGVKNGFAQVPEPAPVIDTGNDAPTDEEIEQRLRAIFSEIETLRQVQVSVSSGVVTLRGEVNEHQQITEAETLA